MCREEVADGVTVGRRGMHTILGATRCCGRLSGIHRGTVGGYKVNPCEACSAPDGCIGGDEPANEALCLVDGLKERGPPVLGDGLRRIEERYAADEHP